MDPDRPAVRQQLDLPAQGIHQVHGALQGEAGQVHHCVRLERQHRFAKGSLLFGCLAIDGYPPHFIPGRVRLVRLALPAGNHAHFVPA